MRLIELIYLVVISAKDCQKGQTQCNESVMLICTDEGYWSKTECPIGSVCRKENDLIGCQNTEESEDNISIDNPIEASNERSKKSKVVTVTVKKNSHKSAKDDQPKTVTVTKKPKEIDFEVDDNGSQNNKIVTYSVLLQNPMGQGSGGNNAMQIKPSFNLQPNNQSNPTSMPSEQQSSFANQGGSSPDSPSSATPQSSNDNSQFPTDSSQSSADSSQPSATPQSSNDNSQSSANPQSSTNNSQPSANPQPSETSNVSSSSTESAQSDSSNMGNQQSNSQQDSKSSSQQNTSSSGSDSGSNTSDNTSGNSGGQMITSQQLTKALKENNMTPNNSYLQVVVKQTNSHFKDKEMAAMFLAQLAHESGGFAHIEEIACKSGGGCAGQYGTGAPGKSYHGRGFIQLSWPENYKNASKDLGMGDKLYQTPEVVASDVDIGMKVSIWYWDKRVVTFPGVKDKKQFGLTTKAINGELECKNNANIDKSKRRYALYKSIAKEMGVKNLASESGCYTM